MIELTVDKAKLDRLLNGLDDFSKSLTDFNKPLKQSAQVLRDEQRDNFRQQGYIYGMWAKLKEGTKQDRKRQGYSPSRPILERTGKLKNGFRVTKVTKTSAAVDNSIKYAKYHQHGTSKMPKRKIIGTSTKSRKAIGLAFGNFIAGNLKKYFKLGK